MKQNFILNESFPNDVLSIILIKAILQEDDKIEALNTIASTCKDIKNLILNPDTWKGLLKIHPLSKTKDIYFQLPHIDSDCLILFDESQAAGLKSINDHLHSLGFDSGTMFISEFGILIQLNEHHQKCHIKLQPSFIKIFHPEKVKNGVYNYILGGLNSILQGSARSVKLTVSTDKNEILEHLEFKGCKFIRPHHFRYCEKFTTIKFSESPAKITTNIPMDYISHLNRIRSHKQLKFTISYTKNNKNIKMKMENQNIQSDYFLLESKCNLLMDNVDSFSFEYQYRDLAEYFSLFLKLNNDVKMTILEDETIIMESCNSSWCSIKIEIENK